MSFLLILMWEFCTMNSQLFYINVFIKSCSFPQPKIRRFSQLNPAKFLIQNVTSKFPLFSMLILLWQFSWMNSQLLYFAHFVVGVLLDEFSINIHLCVHKEFFFPTAKNQPDSVNNNPHKF